MCVDCVLASPRIAQVDPDDEPLPEVALSHYVTLLVWLLFTVSVENRNLGWWEWKCIRWTLTVQGFVRWTPEACG
jgi:hypothetical protein